MDWKKLILGSAISSILQALFYIYLYQQHLEDFVKIGAYLGVVLMASSIVGQKTSVMFVKGLISYENGTVRVLARGLVITTILAIFGQLFMYELGSGISLLLLIMYQQHQEEKLAAKEGS